MKNKDFKDKKCVITGAASGIGRSTAIAMAKLGVELFLTDINAEGLEETVQIITSDGGKVSKYSAFDISQHKKVEEFANNIHTEFGSMDIVMNVAGISTWGEPHELKHEHWAKMINVDLWGVIHGLESFLPEMVKAGKGGHLVNVSSSAGIVALPWHAAYSAAKFGVVGISEVFRYDLKQYNIGVTVICPGAVDTPLKHTVEIIGVDNDDPEVIRLKERFTERAVTPEKVAQLTIKGIKKNKFMVITSFDIKFLYWCKRNVSPLYRLIVKKVNKIVNEAKKSYEQETKN